MQKSDLHHLYPTDSKANGVRGHYEFKDVTGGKKGVNCPASYTEKGGENRFGPPAEHKGNVAISHFYFSIRYQFKISRTEEARFANGIDRILLIMKNVKEMKLSIEFRPIEILLLIFLISQNLFLTSRYLFSKIL